eukprot:TRINITY_DN1062_c0_g1_i1.p1 TRINITY_DN1062_c0_g1~~TRINITY_DN1062_c0_g1_i1.p1  ORF type:complete len:395 (-),score=86.98 TRINITY_DN1062_c0_g1_i1:109-1293(-)
MSEGSRSKVIIGLVVFFSTLLFVVFFFKRLDLNDAKSSVESPRDLQFKDQASREQRAIRDKEFREQDAHEQKEKTQLREQREKRDEREHKDKKEQRERREHNDAMEAKEKKEQRTKREEKDESEAKEKRERREKREQREIYLEQQSLNTRNTGASGAAAQQIPTRSQQAVHFNSPIETTSALHNRAQRFNAIFHGNSWGSKESKSGTGSELSATVNIRGFLAKVFVKYNISTMLDAPCGDFNWQPHIDGIHTIKYTGADIVEAAVQHNKHKITTGEEKFKHFNFIVLDVVGTPIQKYDLIHCRDALQHMPFADAKSAIDNFKSSGSTYLMTNFHEGSPGNKDVQPGDMNPINVMMPPFNFPPPMEYIHEHPNVGGLDGTKMMGIWKLKDVPSYK